MNDRLILLVEDSREDVEALRRCFKRLGVNQALEHVENAGDALQALRLRRADPRRQPALVLLDLNLPGTDGREFLRMVKGDADLCRIPVVVLSSSTNARDIEFCYRNGANAYHVKPMELDEQTRLVAAILSYWLAAVALPDEPRRLAP